MCSKKQVICLCWNCCKEIYRERDIYDVDGELWCKDCARELERDEDYELSL